MQAITYRIELLEPLLATALQGEPNSSESLAYIPGSILRGLWIARYQQREGFVSDLARDPTCRRLFFDGTTRFLHAYPYEPDLKARALPSPRSLRHFKYESAMESGNAIFDTSSAAWSTDEQRKQEQKDSLKAIETPFCHFFSGSNQISFYTPERTLTVHTQRDPKIGRARKGPGQGEIFRYEALAAGEWFQAVILVDDAQDVSKLCELLKHAGTNWLGRSRSAGYGRVQFHFDEGRDVHVGWREIGANATSLPTSQRCTLTLLSDALLSDDNGQPVSSLNEQTLAQILGLPDGQIKQIDADHSFVQSSLRGGFNRTWRLPLAQSYVLTAGSVIAFELATPLNVGDLRQIEMRGIGARRAEGFGRVVFNWHGPMQLTSAEKSSQGPTPDLDDEQLSDLEQQLAQRMARRLFEAHINGNLLSYIKSTTIEPAPQTTQLNRLRTLVRQNINRGNDGTNDVLEQFKGFKSTARQQFERARVQRTGSSQPLDAWIEELLHKPAQSLRKLLSVGSGKAVAGEMPEVDAKLAAQTVLRLLAGLLEKTVREQQVHARKEQPV